MKINDGNELIQNFLPKDPICGGDVKGNPFASIETRYDSWWPGLMNAVEYIESLGYTSVIERVVFENLSFHRVWFNCVETHGSIDGQRDEKKITAVWNAVVAFIKWHNEKKL